MPKRKVDSENRAFQNRWEAGYLFTDIAGRPVCLICGAIVAVFKEFNLRRRYETKHQDNLKDLNAEQKIQKVEELKKKLTFQQDAAVKASFIVVKEIAQAARPFTEGEFLKSCMIKVCNVVCPDKKQILANLSPSRNTAADRVCEMATDLRTQLSESSKDFTTDSLAVDESTDMTDTAQLAIFICGVDSNLRVTEEVDIKSMHGTTTCLKTYHRLSGLVRRMRVKMQEENCTGELTAYHCIIHQEALCGKALKMDHVMSAVTQTVNFMRSKGLNHLQCQSFVREIDSEFANIPYHTEVHWLSWGKVLNRVFELSNEICQFMDSKGTDATILRDEKWKCELAFLADITAHLNALNLQLQGCDRMITDMYDAVKVFQVKLLLWEKQMHQSNLPHFPCCQVMLNQVGPTLFRNTHFADKLSAVRTEFARRFGDSEKQKKNFAVDVETAPVQIQMELIELPCNETVKAKYDPAGPTEFIHSIPATAPQLLLHAARTCMFGSTYLCEKLFSVMKTNKTAHRSRLTDEHLQSILRVSIARDLTPNINEPVAKKRCQASNPHTHTLSLSHSPLLSL
uniref:SPIN-DOC-like zinc-finger domain-containing protein n=1 Tax=Pygocentrus nattereri TaxID=42514 RepID=A0AAR2IK74_PYGNA